MLPRISKVIDSSVTKSQCLKHSLPLLLYVALTVYDIWWMHTILYIHDICTLLFKLIIKLIEHFIRKCWLCYLNMISFYVLDGYKFMSRIVYIWHGFNQNWINYYIIIKMEIVVLKKKGCGLCRTNGKRDFWSRGSTACNVFLFSLSWIREWYY